jgi:tRNA threonylcarbamoyladenosine biosynthesis protein TsaB
MLPGWEEPVGPTRQRRPCPDWLSFEAGQIALYCNSDSSYNRCLMDRPTSIAIETSCRRGGVALGAGDELIETLDFQAERRQSVQLVARLEELLRRHGLRPGDLDEAYVSIGPGSFTGLRVGITVARTLAQTIHRLRCVAVPTVEAVAENAAELDFRHLGVVMDAKEQTVYLAVFARREVPEGGRSRLDAQGGRIVPVGPATLTPVVGLAEALPKPIILIGEALWYQTLEGKGITLADESCWLPTAAGVWRVGRRLARAGHFLDHHALRPLYLRKPEAVRLWEKRRRQGEE